MLYARRSMPNISGGVGKGWGPQKCGLPVETGNLAHPSQGKQLRKEAAGERHLPVPSNAAREAWASFLRPHLLPSARPTPATRWPEPRRQRRGRAARPGASQPGGGHPAWGSCPLAPAAGTEPLGPVPGARSPQSRDREGRRAPHPPRTPSPQVAPGTRGARRARQSYSPTKRGRPGRALRPPPASRRPKPRARRRALRCGSGTRGGPRCRRRGLPGQKSSPVRPGPRFSPGPAASRERRAGGPTDKCPGQSAGAPAAKGGPQSRSAYREARGGRRAGPAARAERATLGPPARTHLVASLPPSARPPRGEWSPGAGTFP